MSWKQNRVLRAFGPQLRRFRSAVLKLPFAAIRGAQFVTGSTSERFGPPRVYSSIQAEQGSPDVVDIVEVVPQITIERQMPLDPGDGGVQVFAKRIKTGQKPAFAARVPRGRCVNEAGWVITQRDHLLADVSIELGANSRALHSSSYVLRLPPCRVFSGSAAIISSAGRRNYFHWILESLPRAYLLQQAGLDVSKADYVFASATSMPFHIQSLEALGVDPKKIVSLAENPHVRADELWVSSIPGVNGNPAPWVVDFLRGLFPDPDGPRKRRLYISRGKTTGPRAATNETDVFGVLEPLGFESIQMEHFTMHEQSDLFKSAEAIVAPHGAGLTNLVFSRPGVKVLEMFGPRYPNPCFWTLANVVGAEYAYILGEGVLDENAGIAGQADPMTVPIDRLKAGLASLGLT